MLNQVADVGAARIEDSRLIIHEISFNVTQPTWRR